MNPGRPTNAQTAAKRESVFVYLLLLLLFISVFAWSMPSAAYALVETRVWGSNGLNAPCIGAESDLSPDLQRGNRSCSSDLVNGCCHAPKAGGIIDKTAKFGQRTLGAAERVTKVLQSGGRTIRNSTAKALNEYAGTDLHKRVWGRALESLKKAEGLRNDFHGKILDNANLIDDAGKVIGSLLDYIP